MPFLRRSREHLSSAMTSQVEVQGESYLCFSQDNSWFQGNINTDDESNYSIYGERVLPPTASSNSFLKLDSSTASTPNESEDEAEAELHSGSDAMSERDFYKMILTDHFTGLSYTLDNVILNPTAVQNINSSLLLSQNAQISFRVDNVYKGQKADMMIQRSIGSQSLLGKKCLVYSGHMDMLFADYEHADSGHTWSMM